MLDAACFEYTCRRLIDLSLIAGLGGTQWWDDWAARVGEGGIEDTCAPEERQNASTDHQGDGSIATAELRKEKADASVKKRLKLDEAQKGQESYLMAKCVLFFENNKNGGAAAALKFAKGVFDRCSLNNGRLKQGGIRLSIKCDEMF